MDNRLAVQDVQPAQQPLPPGLQLFTREALAVSLAAAQSAPPESDDFFELTPQDYARIAASYTAAQPMHLTTQAFREANEAKRAAAFSAAVIRVHLPDGLILQVSIWQST
jgi:hypothetical protein